METSYKKETHVCALNADIKQVWQIIRHSQGYCEWINADVTCYLVKVQMKTMIQHLQQDKNVSRNDEMDFDVLYNNLIRLWDEAGDHVDWSHIQICGNALLNNLYRILYFCK
jgi:hypothetical protein